MNKFVVMLALGLALTPWPAGAQAPDGRKGIAFAQMIESGSGVCVGRSRAEASACAMKECRSYGGDVSRCEVAAYCFPANFSVLISAVGQDGRNWTEFLCGYPSRDSAAQAAKIACDPAQRPDLIFCVPSETFDENGASQPIPF